MIAYIVRRILYMIPILIAVNLLTFFLFFILNTPDNMAHMALGAKRVTAEQVEDWKRERGYDLPLFFNAEAATLLEKVTQTIFVQKSARLFLFDFGRSDNGRNIGFDIRQRMWPSLALAVPTLL